MNLLQYAQKIAYDFNDEVAVWRAFEARKCLREFLGSSLPMDEEVADRLDWEWAERTARRVYAIGFSLP